MFDKVFISSPFSNIRCKIITKSSLKIENLVLWRCIVTKWAKLNNSRDHASNVRFNIDGYNFWGCWQHVSAWFNLNWSLHRKFIKYEVFWIRSILYKIDNVIVFAYSDCYILKWHHEMLTLYVHMFGWNISIYTPIYQNIKEKYAHHIVQHVDIFRRCKNFECIHASGKTNSISTYLSAWLRQEIDPRTEQHQSPMFRMNFANAMVFWNIIKRNSI